jgi:capping protein beta
MEEVNKIKDCIKLIKKLPVDRIEDNITAISNLIYEEDELLNEFLQKVDGRTEICAEDGEFLKCEFNRDGDSYRSPTTNKYIPQTSDARYPSANLRELEIKLNKMFSLYIRAYYSPSTICSVYCWDFGDNIEEGFAVAILIKNNVDLQKEVNKGQWDSNNVINVTFSAIENNKIRVTYKLTTTILLQMNFEHKICGKVSLSGTVSRQVKFL